MKIIKSQIIPIPRKDIDTDLIIPADYLKKTDKQGLREGLFARLRQADANFVMNLPRYQGTEILLAGNNFGCGSSREHAAWALYDWGIRVIIAPSFADIFYKNAVNNNLLPVHLDEKVVDNIFAEEIRAKAFEIEVDLPRQVVKAPGGKEYPFGIDPYLKEKLIGEMDDLDYLLTNMASIKEFDAGHEMNIFLETHEL